MSTTVGYLRRHAGYLVFAVIIMTIPLYLSNTYYLSILAFMGTRFMMALGLSLLLGLAGKLHKADRACSSIGAKCTESRLCKCHHL